MLISIDRLEKWVGIEEAESYVEELIFTINNELELRKKTRLKDANDYYKELLEEYIPLIQFAKCYCGDVPIQIRYSGRISQTYDSKHDGEIRWINGTSVSIEIARPIHGDVIHKRAEQVNLYGYTELDFGDLEDEKDAFVRLIKTTAGKKASKNYSGTILVFCIPDINFLRGLDEELYQNRIEDTVHILQEYNYQAQEVFLLIPPYEGGHSGAAEIFRIQ